MNTTSYGKDLYQVVLHRPVELARLIGKMALDTDSCDFSPDEGYTTVFAEVVVQTESKRGQFQWRALVISDAVSMQDWNATRSFGEGEPVLEYWSESPRSVQSTLTAKERLAYSLVSFGKSTSLGPDAAITPSARFLTGSQTEVRCHEVGSPGTELEFAL